jgi:hypothetical protein
MHLTHMNRKALTSITREQHKQLRRNAYKGFCNVFGISSHHC